MSDLETPPEGWWWNPDVSPNGLDQMLANNKGRLVSLNVRDTSPKRLAAIWIAKGKDDAEAGWSHDIDAATLGQTLEAKKARLVCLEPFVIFGQVRFAAAWIPNKGANATAWWWNPDVDPPALGQMLANNKGRLITLRSYVVGDKRHHAAVWVDNTGPKGQAWWWNPDVDPATLGAMLSNNKGRLVCLDPFLVKGELRLGAAWVENTGSHGKAWWWYLGLGAETLGHKFDVFCTYGAELQTYPAGNERHLACVMYAYPQPALEAAKLVEVTGSAQLVSQSNSMAPLDQTQKLSITLENNTASSVEITGGRVLLTESGGFVNGDPVPVYGSGTLLGSAPITLNPGDSKVVSHNYSLGAGVADFVLNLTAESGGQTQHVQKSFPIIRGGFPAPPGLSAPHPVYFGMWTNPAEIVPLWFDEEKLWISIAGHVVKTSEWTARLASWHLSLEIDHEMVIDKELDLQLWSINNSGVLDLVVGADGAAYLTGLKSFFSFGFELDGVSKDFKAGTLTLSANYKIQDVCGSCVYQSPVRFVKPVSILSPVKGLAAKRFWGFGNGPNHTGKDAHEWPQERYAYDIGMVDDTGSSHSSNDADEMQKNINFFCYGKPIFAVRSGTVVGADDSVPENFGSTANPEAVKSNNYVLIDHGDGSYAGYYHCRQGKNMVKKGGTVTAGQQIAEIGNAGGSSEPHLHFAYVAPDSTGRGTVVPTIFTDLKTKADEAVTAVPANGQYIA